MHSSSHSLSSQGGTQAQQAHGLIAGGAADLALHMAPVVLDADVRPGADLHEASPQHLGVEGSHLPRDVGLELLQGGWHRRVGFVLQDTPDCKVEDVDVWGARGPGPSPDTFPGDQSPIKLIFQIGDVAPGAMGSGAVLTKC